MLKPWPLIKICFLVSALYLLTSCTVELISGPDNMMVDQLQALQKQINIILVSNEQNFGATNVAYNNYTQDYINFDVTMTDLISTSKAIPNNEATVKQLALLQSSIAEMQSMQKKGFTSVDEIQILKETINDEFTAMYELQDIKKSYTPTSGGGGL